MRGNIWLYKKHQIPRTRVCHINCSSSVRYKWSCAYKESKTSHCVAFEGNIYRLINGNKTKVEVVACIDIHLQLKCILGLKSTNASSIDFKGTLHLPIVYNID